MQSRRRRLSPDLDSTAAAKFPARPSLSNNVSTLLRIDFVSYLWYMVRTRWQMWTTSAAGNLIAARPYSVTTFDFSSNSTRQTRTKAGYAAGLTLALIGSMSYEDEDSRPCGLTVHQRHLLESRYIWTYNCRAGARDCVRARLALFEILQSEIFTNCVVDYYP